MYGVYYKEIESVYSIGTLYYDLSDIKAKSFTYSLLRVNNNINTIELPLIDNNALLNEDLDTNDTPRLRFCIFQNVNIDLLNQSNFDTLANGNKIWRLKIISENAFSINLLFSGIIDIF